MRKVRVVVVGAGAFGRNHLRVTRASGRAELAGVVDTDPDRARAAAAEFACPVLTLDQAPAHADAAIVAVPTRAHSEAGCALLEAGLDVLVEKPIAPDPASARKLIDTARARCRILQVGHLERFNPAVAALRASVTLPLFFEIHRLSVFSPRSLDVDVVLDLMIHDLDIVLALVGDEPEEIRAAGISILSPKVDIATARLAFPNGCVANLTASRVSTERVRKLRLFQPRQYISLDYARQGAAVFEVAGPGAAPSIGFRMLPVEKDEPLRLELESFFEAVATRAAAAVRGEDGLRALEVARAVLDRIEEHSRRVEQSLAVWKPDESRRAPSRSS
jgi:predicted dehydrogenase